jgi:hypothetical protein
MKNNNRVTAHSENKRGLVTFISSILFIALVTSVNYGGGCSDKTVSSGSSNAPIVITTYATNVNSSSATLNGTVNPNGFLCTCYFYWESLGYMMYNGVTSSQNIVIGTDPVNVSASVTTLILQNGIGDYKYRIIATNASGTSYGDYAYFNILP